MRWPSASTTACSRGSIACARTPSRVSTPCASHQSAGRTSSWSRDSSPRRYALESPGRSYGSTGSSPTSTRRPSKPSSRSVAAAVAPAREAPTTTKVCAGATERLDLDLYLPVHLARRIHLDRHRRRSLHHGAGLQLEDAAVALALEFRAVELAFGQRTPLVCADVAEGVQGALDASDADARPLDLEVRHVALADLARRTDRDQLAHRYVLLGWRVTQA